MLERSLLTEDSGHQDLWVNSGGTVFFKLWKRGAMSGEMEAPHVYEDVQMEERHKNIVEKKSQKRWLVTVSAVAIVLFGIVCFAAGFAVAYFAVPSAGRCVFSKIILFFFTPISVKHAMHSCNIH